MRIAFYAPMKAPDDPTPSGDRLVARNLVAALRMAGHEVEVASRFRSYDRGDPRRQARLAALGKSCAGRLLRRIDQGAARPDLWFTYHLYHKAPDHLGPAIASALGIPYVAAEASVASKQRGGPFDAGLDASLVALARADLVVTLNPNDAAGVLPHLRPGVPMAALAPFIDATPFLAAAKDRKASRARLAERYGLSPARPWLVAAAMMRADQKLLSYRLLAEALSLIEDEGFELLVAGSGPAEAEVRRAFSDKGVRATFLGEVTAEDMPALLAACDLSVWPAVKEAFGMALIEAQAAGLPVVAGKSPGVAAVVDDGGTGLLPASGDAAAFAAAVRSLLDPVRRAAFSVAARQHAAGRHDIAAAAASLDREIGRAVTRFRARDNTSHSIKRAV